MAKRLRAVSYVVSNFSVGENASAKRESLNKYMMEIGTERSDRFHGLAIFVFYWIILILG
ncbi:MAG: hypothetical protein P4L69_03130 [Desulfosporosinus sp.]|nr:hypothetical protein [Desulfosporosinus sp.]